MATKDSGVFNLISVTEAAQKAITAILANREEPALGVRVVLTTKGCSGLSLNLEIVETDNNIDDKVKLNDNITIFIDKKASLYILGTELDYVETDLENGFTFINPNEKGRCGCGSSFYV